MAPDEMSRRTRRAFLTGGLASVAGFAGWKWLMSRGEAGGIPWPLRKMLGLNEKLWTALSSNERLSRSVQVPASKEPRFNGDLGIQQEIDLATWKLRVYASPKADEPSLSLEMKDLLRLPRTEMAVEFKCIEGWSDKNSYAGVRFSDFLDAYGLAKTNPYVALETPDRGYYVSLDMKSMLHPQTLLCYEMNRQSLDAENGAPLRLVIPIKYGIKSLKRIGRIRFADARPPDYWAERGYDWYAGL